MACPACGNAVVGVGVAGYCSWLCKTKGRAPPVVPPVIVTCKVCGKKATVAADSLQVTHQVCSKTCYDKPSTGEAMLNFLFTQSGKSPVAGRIVDLLDDRDLGRVAQASKTLKRPAQIGQLGSWYGDHDAKHYDPKRGEVTIPADKIVDVALQSYTTATRLMSSGLPVILYRVFDRKYLTEAEELKQTVAGAVRIEDNLWPVERTAAWIQGAMRARIPFLLLTDPRGAEALIGGKDKKSDAVYVRELFQIIQTFYTFGVSVEGDLPQKLKGSSVKLFKMIPPGKPLGPMPLVPKMSKAMDFSHTWDSTKSSLSVNDSDVDTMAGFVRRAFVEAGPALGIAAY